MYTELLKVANIFTLFNAKYFYYHLLFLYILRTFATLERKYMQ